MPEARTRFLHKATPQTSQVILLAATVVRMMLSLVLTVLVGRHLAPEEFGFFALVTTVFGLGFEFTDLGTANVAARGIARDPAGERAMLEHLFGLRLVLGLVTALACLMLALAQPAPGHELILLLAAAALGFSYVGGLTTVYMVRQWQVPPSLLTVSVQFAAIVAAILLIWRDVPQKFFPLLPVAREAAMFAGLAWIGSRVLGYMPRPRFSRAALKPFFGRAAAVALATLFYHLQTQSGIFFVEFLRPEIEMAPFGAALRPMAPILQMPGVLTLPLIPLLSWLAAGRRGEFRRQAGAGIALFIGFGAVAAAASYQLAPAVLHILYGGKFSGGALSAVETLRWMALPLGCAFASTANASVLFSDNRETDVLKLTAGGLVFYVAANLLLLPRFGYPGSAMASALSAAAMTGGGLALLRFGREPIAPGAGALASLIPGAVLFCVLDLIGGYFPDSAAILHFAAGTVLTGAAMIAVWQLPSAVRYRAEQSALSQMALEGGPLSRGLHG